MATRAVSQSEKPLGGSTFESFCFLFFSAFFALPGEPSAHFQLVELQTFLLSILKLPDLHKANPLRTFAWKISAAESAQRLRLFDARCYSQTPSASGFEATAAAHKCCACHEHYHTCGDHSKRETQKFAQNVMRAPSKKTHEDACRSPNRPDP